jgi:hypothetical protein
VASFELFVEGRRIFGDSGNCDYRRGERRNYFRSTAAHNTAFLDGVEQSRLFDVFRGGRLCRGRMEEIVQGDYRTTIDVSWEPVGPGARGEQHRRRFVLLYDEGLIVVDWLVSGGSRALLSALHPVPGREDTLWAGVLEGEELEEVPGFFAPDFGDCHEVAVRRFAGPGRLVYATSWLEPDEETRERWLALARRIPGPVE